MPLLPFHILGIWLRGLLSLAIPILAVVCLTWWYDDSRSVDRAEVIRVAATPPGAVTTTVRTEHIPAKDLDGPDRPAFHFEPGWNRPTAELAAAIALLAWAVAGAWIGRGLGAIGSQLGRAAGAGGQSHGKADRARVVGPDWLSGRGPIDDAEPQPEPPTRLRTGAAHHIRRPDGSVLRVETYGPDDAPPLILTHGWGADSDEWYYQKRHLAGRFRLIVWDLAGLGYSTQPDNRDYSMEKLAADLEAVLALAGGRPAVLVGHSIGAMILLTFSRLFPEALGGRVAGLVPVHGSYKDPIQTVKNAPLYEALRVPVLIPLLRLTIAVWPLVMLMNWLSYLNGTLQRQTRQQSFAGPGTRAQENFLARFMASARPDVLARGMFGMMAFDESATLPTIHVPTLVVIGDKDITTLPEAGEYIARHVPGAVAVTLSPARHLGLFEYHGQFDQILADFAASCLTAATTTVVTT